MSDTSTRDRLMMDSWVLYSKPCTIGNCGIRYGIKKKLCGECHLHARHRLIPDMIVLVRSITVFGKRPQVRENSKAVSTVVMWGTAEASSRG